MKKTDLNELVEMAKEWAAAKEEAGKCRTRVAELARMAYDRGATEMEISQAVGVARPTVRAMLGKKTH